MKSNHMLFCAALLLVGIVLFAGGLGSFGFVPLVACMLMMGAMMWMMMRPGNGRHGDR